MYNDKIHSDALFWWNNQANYETEMSISNRQKIQHKVCWNHQFN